MSSCGYLEIALGPMFASKSSWLISQYKQYKVYTDKIKVINFSGDSRYSKTELSTHDHIMIPCLQTEKLYDVNIDNDVEVILINEGQFFVDIVHWVKEMVDKRHMKVYICGLDGDYKREKFGDLIDLIPFCDKITKLTAVCGKCKNGTRAIFTIRTTESSEQVLIGEKDHYLPVCRKCYIDICKSI
jgi:thymidine kinase